jgi:hypothetical protein
MMKLDPFNLEHAKQVTTYPTRRELGLGVKLIDFKKLAEPGTALYVVVQEGQASEYATFLATFFGHASSVIRKITHSRPSAQVLFVYDEAGNVPLVNLSETLGVGRGRGMGVVLGYQNVSQVYMHYEQHEAEAILGSGGTRIFLPGSNFKTAAYAAEEIGRTTVLSYASSDSEEGSRGDVRLAEAGRDLIDPAEVRQLKQFKQMLILTGTVPPIRMNFPQLTKRDRPVAPPVYPRAIPVGYEEALKSSPENKSSSRDTSETPRIERPPELHGNQNPEQSHAESIPTRRPNKRPAKASPDGRPVKERIVSYLNLAGYFSTKQVVELCFNHLQTENARKSKASAVLGELVKDKAIKSLFFQREKIYFTGKTPNPRPHDLAVRQLLVRILKSGYEITDVKLSPDLNDLVPDLEVAFMGEDGQQIRTFWEYDSGTERNRELLSKLGRYASRGDEGPVTFVFETEERLESFLRAVKGSGGVRFAVLSEIQSLDQAVFRKGGAESSGGVSSVREPFFLIRPFLVTPVK